MKILLAPDKFKGSLTANEVCMAIGKGLQKHQPAAEIIFHPMADGGDGSLEILSAHLNLKKQKVEVVDPLGRLISAHYYISENAAFIEVASASGLVLLAEKERNPMLTSTLGTGQMIADALEKGCRYIYLFLGGSATNDAGIGIAQALGFRFFDANKNELFPSGENLSKIYKIEKSPLYDFSEIKVTLLCDVNNPLYGPDGAAHVYAKQKGATPRQIKILDNGLRHFSELIFREYKTDLRNLNGGGAAGGISAGLYALLNAEIKPGFDTISELTNLEEKIKAADYVISGEGRLDGQSLQGKVIDGIAKICRKNKKPFSLFVGKNELTAEQIKPLKVEYIFTISDRAKNVEDAMSNGAAYLSEIAEYFMVTNHKSEIILRK